VSHDPKPLKEAAKSWQRRETVVVRMARRAKSTAVNQMSTRQMEKNRRRRSERLHVDPSHQVGSHSFGQKQHDSTRILFLLVLITKKK